MYKLLDWSDPSSGGLFVAFAVIVGGLVTWRLLYRARNVAAEIDNPSANLLSPITDETRGSISSGEKRKKRRRGSGGAGQQPRSQRKKRNKIKEKDLSDRVKENGTQESNTSSDSDRLQQDTEHEKKEGCGNIGGRIQPQADDKGQLVACRHPPSDMNSQEHEVLSDTDQSVVSVDDACSRVVPDCVEPVNDEPITKDSNTLMISTIGFVEDHFRHDEDDKKEEGEKSLNQQELNDSESALLESALVNEQEQG